MNLAENLFRIALPLCVLGSAGQSGYAEVDMPVHTRCLLRRDHPKPSWLLADLFQIYGI